MTPFLFILACVGCTQILCYGRIFKPIRDRLGFEFLHCPMCVGFWVGLFAYMFSTSLPAVFSIMPGLAWGFISSLCSYGWCMVVTDDGVRIAGRKTDNRQ